MRSTTASKWGAAAAIAVVCSLSGCGGAGSKSPTAPGAIVESFAEPVTHRAPLPGGGEITLRFVEFQPARGARLVADKGAYVSVHYEMPRRAVLVSVAGDAWDGTNPLQTSFMSSNIRFALPVCASDGLLSRTDQLGQASSPRAEFPRPGDPDVAFVRVRIWGDRLASRVRGGEPSDATHRPDPGEHAHADGNRKSRVASALNRVPDYARDEREAL